MEAKTSIFDKIVEAFRSLSFARSSSQSSTHHTLLPSYTTVELEAKSREWYNILLIGETGSGKTSFLNLLCFFNLIQEVGWDKALEQRLEVYNDVTIENEAAEELMESKTLTSKYYKFNFKSLNVGILDTPGFGDSRGLEKDKENVKNIVDRVNEVQSIHCICLVINGTLSRMTTQLKYVVSEISSILPKATVHNILVVFTNVSNKKKSNFPLAALNRTLGIVIPETNMFYIDNPYSMFKKDSTCIPSSSESDFMAASDTFECMCKRLAEFERIYTDLFMDLYWTKVAVERKTCELMQQVEYNTEVDAKLSQKRKEIESSVKTRAKVFEDFVAKWSIEKTQRHNTLCALCKSNCHSPCNLDKTFDKEVLKSCTAMQPLTTTCSVCQHSYDLHYHDEFTFKKEIEKLVDEVKLAQFNEAVEPSDIEDLATELITEIDKKSISVNDDTETIYSDLMNKLTHFYERASLQNYKNLVESQFMLVEYRLTTDSRNIILLKAKSELESKLAVISEAENRRPQCIPCRDLVI